MAGNGSVALKRLVEEKFIDTPCQLSALYKGHNISATVTKDAKVLYNGKEYNSLSVAGGVAIVDTGAPPTKGLPYRHVNGWTFWKCIRNDETVPMSALRSLIDR